LTVARRESFYSGLGDERSRGRMQRTTRVVTAHLGILVLTVAALAGCGDDDDDQQPSATTAAGLANPASEFCVSQGGEVEIVDETGGQVGYCNLPDGTRVEEWEYFRAHAGTTTAP
jgi:uncharacterized protein